MSSGKIYATHPEDLMEAVVVAKGMQETKGRDGVKCRREFARRAWRSRSWRQFRCGTGRCRDLYQIGQGCLPVSRALTLRQNFLGVVRLVSGHYPRELFSSLKALASIGTGRVTCTSSSLPGTRMMAISNGGAIVDRMVPFP